jgi:hypothetical protein
MIKKILIAIIMLIILVAVAALIGKYSFDRMVSKEVMELFKNAGKEKPERITEADINRLPEPVQRYMRYTKAVGKEKIHTVRLKQTGKIRMKPDAKWMPFEAEQYYTTDNPAFIWKANVTFAPLLWISGKDSFAEGKGNMLIKVLSLIKVVDGSGPELDQGALCRYLNEMMWFPNAYLNDYVKWEPMDANSARATMTVKGVTASALLKFSDEGKLVDFVAQRFMSSGDKYVKELWSTPVEDYKEFNNIVLPAKGRAVWILKTGDFCYIELELVDIEYNVAEEY